MALLMPMNINPWVGATFVALLLLFGVVGLALSYPGRWKS